MPALRIGGINSPRALLGDRQPVKAKSNVRIGDYRAAQRHPRTLGDDHG
jgi:hypothetical protein